MLEIMLSQRMKPRNHYRLARKLLFQDEGNIFVMKKIRIVSKKDIKKAYEKEPEEKYSTDYSDEDYIDIVDKIPDEVFSIVSQVVDFVHEIEK